MSDFSVKSPVVVSVKGLPSFIISGGNLDLGRENKQRVVKGGDLRGFVVNETTLKELLAQMPASKGLQKGVETKRADELINLFNIAIKLMDTKQPLDLKGMDLSGKYLDGMEFVNCDLRDVNFKGASLWRTIFFNDRFSSKTNFEDAGIWFTAFVGPVKEEDVPNFPGSIFFWKEPIFSENWENIMVSLENQKKVDLYECSWKFICDNTKMDPELRVTLESRGINPLSERLEGVRRCVKYYEAKNSDKLAQLGPL
jgi:hypothetical protein